MKPKKPTKRQLEIIRRFKGGERIDQLVHEHVAACASHTKAQQYVEQAIRTVALWEDKR